MSIEELERMRVLRKKDDTNNNDHFLCVHARGEG